MLKTICRRSQVLVKALFKAQATFHFKMSVWASHVVKITIFRFCKYLHCQTSSSLWKMGISNYKIFFVRYPSNPSSLPEPISFWLWITEKIILTRQLLGKYIKTNLLVTWPRESEQENGLNSTFKDTTRQISNWYWTATEQ